jgi:hypothetical protein
MSPFESGNQIDLASGGGARAAPTAGSRWLLRGVWLSIAGVVGVLLLAAWDRLEEASEQSH